MSDELTMRGQGDLTVVLDHTDLEPLAKALYPYLLQILIRDERMLRALRIALDNGPDGPGERR